MRLERNHLWTRDEWISATHLVLGSVAETLYVSRRRPFFGQHVYSHACYATREDIDMGRLFKRGRTWYAQYKDAQGQWRKRSTGTSDKAVARARLRDLELGTRSKEGLPTTTLDQALAYYIEVACAEKPAATIHSYKHKACHLARVLGDTTVDQLDKEILQRYIAQRLEENASTHTIYKELVTLRGTLRSAKDRGLFHGELNIIPSFKARYQPRSTYLTPMQFMALAEELSPPRRFFCLIIVFASCRLGELLRLQWEDVDFHRGVIRVPKGKTRSRVVPIAAQLHPLVGGLRRRYWSGCGTLEQCSSGSSRRLQARRRSEGHAQRPAADLRLLAQAAGSRFYGRRPPARSQHREDGRAGLRTPQRRDLPRRD